LSRPKSRQKDRLADRLARLDLDSLRGLQRGLEKEGLRANPDGTLALTPHAAGLGSALLHPAITTDFSESQLELITGVHADIDACLQQLKEVHQVVYRQIGAEVMWCASMPCSLPADEVIPIGRYGTSNVGRAKTVYRIGLKHRYGSRMQTISGLHYNFSLPASAWPALRAADGHQGDPRDHRDDSYFSLIRNFRRDSWLLLYLFGASPVVCDNFVAGSDHRLQPLNETTMYLPHATSLRMGPLGYQSNAQSKLGVSYNCLRSYADSLREALTTPYPPYEAIGLQDENGEYRQLSTSLLQIENEFYGTIRPKQPVQPGERPLRALASRGVEYVEVRLMDLDPFSPIGITAQTIRFLDIFLLHCLLHDSPKDSPASIAILSRNRHAVAQRGREPGLELEKDDGSTIRLPDWGRELLDECEPVAAALDAAHGGAGYAQVLEQARRLLEDPALTPSARVLERVRTDDTASCTGFALQESLRHRQALLAEPLPAEVVERYEKMAVDSVAAQRAAEDADQLPFEAFRRQYLSQPLVEDIRVTTRRAG
jgi:glutamate--cysteine ligase